MSIRLVGGNNNPRPIKIEEDQESVPSRSFCCSVSRKSMQTFRKCALAALVVLGSGSLPSASAQHRREFDLQADTLQVSGEADEALVEIHKLFDESMKASEAFRNTNLLVVQQKKEELQILREQQQAEKGSWLSGISGAGDLSRRINQLEREISQGNEIVDEMNTNAISLMGKFGASMVKLKGALDLVTNRVLMLTRRAHPAEADKEL
jgi:hypothetical protein